MRNILDEEDVIIEDEDSSLYQIINLFYIFKKIIQTDDLRAGDISDNVFCTHVHNNRLLIDEK